MSLKTWKETLKLCTNDNHSTSTSYNSSLSDQIDTNRNPRIPPKTSLFKQLLRIQDPSVSLLQIDTESETHVVKDEKEADGSSLGGSKSDISPFDNTGPYEPLVLSESPLVQVRFFLFLNFCIIVIERL